MNKKEFIETLSLTEGVSFEKKLECLQHFIDNYPVLIDENITHGPIQIKTGNKHWTKLETTITGGSDKLTNIAFVKLQQRKEELEKFE